MHGVGGRRVFAGVNLQVNMMSLNSTHTPMSQPRLDPDDSMNPVLCLTCVLWPRST